MGSDVNYERSKTSTLSFTLKSILKCSF